jgi:hypothetical protein
MPQRERPLLERPARDGVLAQKGDAGVALGIGDEFAERLGLGRLAADAIMDGNRLSAAAFGLRVEHVTATARSARAGPTPAVAGPPTPVASRGLSRRRGFNFCFRHGQNREPEGALATLTLGAFP